MKELPKILLDSRFVADVFGKRHSNVLHDIAGLACPEDFKRTNFRQAKYVNLQEKKQPCYHMTFGGFMLLILGYTGKKAARIKESFIAEPHNLYESFMAYVEQNGPMGLDEADAETGNPTKYKHIKVDGKSQLEHRIIWEDIFGPLPEGAVIHHKDGDKGNNSIDNLMMFPNSASHVRYHAAHNDYFKEQRGKLRDCKTDRFNQKHTDTETQIVRFNTQTDRMECDELTEEFGLSYSNNPKELSREYDMLDRIALGMTTQEYRKLHGIPNGISIWEHFSEYEKDAVESVQLADIGLVHVIAERGKREQILRDFKEKYLDDPFRGTSEDDPYVTIDYIRKRPDAIFYV